MLNYIWLGLLLLAVVLGGINGSLDQVTQAGLERAEYAVMKLALPLAGIMALWLGLMRLAERAGFVQALAGLLRPLLRRLFPDVPADHPALGSMVMNMAANMLGLANAATPLGLRAMKDLETLNPRPGTASNAMCTFLAINTGSIQLLPLTAIGVLAVHGAVHPTAIVGPALLASFCATVAGISAAKWMERWPLFRLPARSDAEQTPAPPDVEPHEVAAVPGATEPLRPMPFWGGLIIVGFVGFFVYLFLLQVLAADESRLFVRVVKTASLLAVPFLFTWFPLVAALKGVKVYEEFVEGGKEGFQVALRIIPFLVAILVAVGMFRAAGGIELVTQGLRPILERLRFPAELVPLCLMRPLSGSGTLGLFTDLVKTHGADSLLATMGGTIFGSTETTLYVVAVYFGSVAVHRTRHAVPAGLVADGVGMVASVLICRWMFG
ncbi:MAG: spore maturation protein [Verrucomicrobia bacterium]|jgi:spore maturation protein SpmA|nr:spore maturation protein [Verrucomicrobiota bacterium]